MQKDRMLRDSMGERRVLGALEEPAEIKGAVPNYRERARSSPPSTRCEGFVTTA